MTYKIKRYLPFVLILILFAACVPNKRIVYLQNQEPERDAITRSDSAIRTYTTFRTDYLLKPTDVISLRIASLTPSEYNFVKQYEEQLGLIRRLNQYDQSTQAGGNQQQRMQAGAGGVNEGLNPILLDRQQTGFELDAEGYLELPVIGKLQMSGMTIAEAEKLIKEKLLSYFETPVVRIQLLSFQFTILGEVNKEGRYTTFDPNSSIIDAIILAGNLTDFADRSKIKVVRTEGNRAEIIYLNTLREDLLGQSGFYLQPNDLIIVPPLQARATRRYTLPNSTTLLGVFASTLSIVLLIVNLNNNN